MNAPKGRSEKAGLPPGTLVYTGEKRMDAARITVLMYDAAGYREEEVRDAAGLAAFREGTGVTWINVSGLHDVELLAQIGETFDIHRLIMEDVLSIDQRPRVEDLGAYLYLVFRKLSFDEERRRIPTEQISLILGGHFVISFLEHEDGLFETVRERIRLDKGTIRKAGADYLLYALIDVAVDHYFTVLEEVGEEVDRLSEEVLAKPEPAVLQELQRAKRDLLYFHRAVWPLRELIATLLRPTTELIRETTSVYLRDVYDHTIQVMDTVEIYREMLAGAVDIYLSSVSNRLNQVMKVLTVIATIFIPLTFLAGVYGMNFKTLPELEWPWAYGAFWLVCVLVSIFMLLYFRRKKWL